MIKKIVLPKSKINMINEKMYKMALRQCYLAIFILIIITVTIFFDGLNTIYSMLFGMYLMYLLCSLEDAWNWSKNKLWEGHKYTKKDSCTEK